MKPITEQSNDETTDIDRRSTLEIVALINAEDRKVAEAVSRVLDPVARAVDLIAERLRVGGRLFYVGTGTSGRLGVLDASECPPTFGIPPDLVRGIIAGGDKALRQAVEGAEDDRNQGARDLTDAGLLTKDVVVGLSASGTTPYTLGAVDHARGIGAATVSVTCNPESQLASAADVNIAPVVGPEVIAGSSRMKAGTAEKMILNMLSTGAMIKLGFVYGNLMSNLQASNEKLRRRALAILSEQANVTAEEAAGIFAAAGGDLRTAMVMARADLDRAEAEQLIRSQGGSARRALDSLRK